MSYLQTYEKNDNQMCQKIILYMLWPFGTWLSCLRTPNTKSSYLIFFLFSLLICWHMSPAEMSSIKDDFTGIVERFISTDISWQQLCKEYDLYFSLSDDSMKDLFELTLTYIVKEYFDGNYHFFFLLSSIPVAYCQLRCLRYFTNDDKFASRTWDAFFLIFMFIFVRDIFTCQNPRFSIGFWVCVTSTLTFFLLPHKKIICALLITTSPFFHSGLLVYVLIFWILIFVRNKTLANYASLLSIPFIFFDADIFSDLNINIGIVPSSIQNWVELYMSDDFYAKYVGGEGKSGFWWISASFRYFNKIAIILLTFDIIKSNEQNNDNLSLEFFKQYYLLFFALVNMIQFVPVLGGRYYWILEAFCIVLWFKLVYPEKRTHLYLLVISCIWPIVQRYGYVFGGALAVHTPIDLFYSPLPYLIGKGLLW